MRKGTKLVKRLLALFLVVLMSINSFGAVVSDNDGAAFVTKAEFDSLKNNFQSQINQYNSSIDNKIDGAIASYLAGVTVAKQSKLVDMVAEAKDKSTMNVSFVKWETPATAKDTADVEAKLYWKYVNKTARVRDANRRENEIFGGFQLNNNSVWSGSGVFVRYHDYDKTTSDYNSAYYVVEFPFGEKNFETRQTEVNVTDFTLNDTRRQRCHFYITSTVDAWNDLTLQTYDSTSWVGYPNPIVNDFTTGTFASGPAVGNSSSSFRVWFGVNLAPQFGISHSWSIYSDTGRANKKLDYMYSATMSGNTTAVDFAFRDSYVADNQLNLPIARTKPADTTQGDPAGNWIFAQYWVVPASGDPYLGNISNTNWPAYDNRPEFRFKWNRQKIYTLNWTKLTHKYYNDKFSAAYYKFEGIPICRTPNKAGKLKFKLKFTNKVLTTNANLAPASGNYTYAIMDKKFKNGNLPTTTETDSYYKDSDGYNHVLKRETKNSGSYVWTTDWIEIDKTKVIDEDNGDYIYIKVAPNNDDQVVMVEVVDAITYTED